MAEIINQFEKTTFGLSPDKKLKKLDELLLGGWQNTKEYIGVRKKLENLGKRINNHGAENK